MVDEDIGDTIVSNIATVKKGAKPDL